ncbi:MAG: hypothetical protein JXB00_02415 [Bacteroidales bacterium]|nr:hypothetical protein [Bacteroidales bacterium]
MIEKLIGSLKSEVGGQILEQTKLPSKNLNKVFSIIGDVTKKEVTGKMLGGDLSSVMNLFSNKPNNKGADLLQGNIVSGVVSNLISKLGLSKDMSNKIAQIAVPALINMITNKNSKTPDDDASPLNELFGGGGKGIASVAKGLLGKFLK